MVTRHHLSQITVFIILMQTSQIFTSYRLQPASFNSPPQWQKKKDF